MRIAFLDLSHDTKGIHTNTVPLGSGLIAQYLRKNVNDDFDIKIFKIAKEAIDCFENWQPDVIALALYTWNTELNLYVARRVKKINPSVNIIAGGPNLELSAEGKKQFLIKENYIDICIAFDGEIPFAALIKRLVNGEKINDLKKSPSPGTYSILPDSKKLVESSDRPRLDNLDVHGTPYSEGIFDDLLSDGYNPFLQTHRGCPFKCTFCHTSDDYYNKMLFISIDLFKKEMEYLGKRFASQDHVVLYLANTNMSQFPHDFKVADVIKETQKKYNWPKVIRVNSGKNPTKLLKMLSTIEFIPGIALQSLTDSVLQNINRINIPFEKFYTFQEQVYKKLKLASSTELIICLPGESKESFMQTLTTVINSGINRITIYSLMKLKGTPISTKENEKRFQYKVCHRLVPRNFSAIENDKIFDSEEVIVGTNTMPFEDYVQIRAFSLIISIFPGKEDLIPLKNILIEKKMDIFEWTLKIPNKIKDYPDLHGCYQAFINEAKSELFESKEQLVNFYSQDENYKKLLSGEFGDNLLRKYGCIILSKHYESYIECAISVVEEMLNEKFNNNEMETILKDIDVFLKTRSLKQYLDNNVKTFKDEYITFSYDIPRWLLKPEDSNATIDQYKGKYTYKVKLHKDSIDKIFNISKIHKDSELSLQMLYRLGSIRDYWPSFISLKGRAPYSISVKKRH